MLTWNLQRLDVCCCAATLVISPFSLFQPLRHYAFRSLSQINTGTQGHRKQDGLLQHQWWKQGKNFIVYECFITQHIELWNTYLISVSVVLVNHDAYCIIYYCPNRVFHNLHEFPFFVSRILLATKQRRCWAKVRHWWVEVSRIVLLFAKFSSIFSWDCPTHCQFVINLYYIPHIFFTEHQEYRFSLQTGTSLFRCSQCSWPFITSAGAGNFVGGVDL